MGCCEFRDTGKTIEKGVIESNEMFLTMQHSSSIKSPGLDNDRIRLKNKSIQETNNFPCNVPSTEGWNLLSRQDFIQIKYFEHEFVQAFINIKFFEPIFYEVILNAINKPFYRNRWDNKISKMNVVIGDDILDAKLCIRGGKILMIKNFERIVRKVNSEYFIFYHSEGNEKKYEESLFIFGHEEKFIKVFLKEKDRKIEEFLEEIGNWAKSLRNEVINLNEITKV